MLLDWHTFSLSAGYTLVTKKEIKELIKRRRAQMLIHSYLYYHLDNPVISDDKWQEWANELTELQTKNPDCCIIKYFDRDFFDWNGSTGMHLPKNDYVASRASYILKIHEKNTRPQVHQYLQPQAC